MAVLHSKEVEIKGGQMPPAVLKGILLRHLVWARMFWSTDYEAFSSGLEAFLKAIVDKPKWLRHPELFISITCAGVDLFRFLGVVKPEFIRVKDFRRYASTHAL